VVRFKRRKITIASLRFRTISKQQKLFVDDLNSFMDMSKTKEAKKVYERSD
jgi:hypothetical protein